MNKIYGLIIALVIVSSANADNGLNKNKFKMIITDLDSLSVQIDNIKAKLKEIESNDVFSTVNERTEVVEEYTYICDSKGCKKVKIDPDRTRVYTRNGLFRCIHDDGTELTWNGKSWYREQVTQQAPLLNSIPFLGNFGGGNCSGGR